MISLLDYNRKVSQFFLPGIIWVIYFFLVNYEVFESWKRVLNQFWNFYFHFVLKSDVYLNFIINFCRQPPKPGKLSLNQNLTFCACDSVDRDEKRPLLVLFAWLFAKERHLDKYRKLYIEKGFDVLTVKIQVLDFLIPSRGSHVVAQNIVDFLREHDTKYPTFIFHAFSVGAYQMGEVFVHLKKGQNQSVLDKTQQSLKGQN